MSADISDEFMQYLAKHSKISWIAEFEVTLDAAFLVWADSIIEFQ